ncbi:MAG: autotransporter-associated beta strand repeat-containing protein [Phycisphaerae bacterium]|jgi:autotransporter-associated beta strand protein
MRLFHISGFALTLICLTVNGTAVADDGWWAVDADGDWDDPSNWVDGIIADGAGHTAYFTLDISALRTVYLNGDRTIGHLEFSVGGGSGQRWSLRAGSPGGTLTLSAPSGTPAITAETTTTVIVPLNTDDGFIKLGGGNLILARDSTVSGNVIVNYGHLSFEASDILTDDATLLFWGGVAQFFITGETFGGLAGNGRLCLYHGIQITVGAGGQTTEFTGYVDELDPGGSIVKSGGGTLTFSNASNDYTGGTVLLGGRLSVSDQTHLGDRYGTAGPLTFDGGMLQITGTTFGSTTLPIVWEANGGGFDIVEPSHTFTVTQDLTGSGDLTKAGPGTLSLTGDNSAYAGTIHVNEGSLTAGVNDSLGDYTDVDVASGATLLLEDAVGWGGLAGDGQIDTNGYAIGLGNDGEDSIFDGEISGGGQVEKKGAGTLTLAGANTYTGGTFIDAGTVQVTGADERLADTGEVNVDAESTFLVDGINETIGALTGQGNATTSNGWLLVGGGDATSTFEGTLSGSVTKIGSGTLTLSGDNSELSFIAVNSGMLVASNEQSLGLDTDMCLWTTLRIDSDQNFGGLSCNGQLDTNGYIVGLGNDNEDTTFGGGFAGNGEVWKRGSGVLTLTGQCDHAGRTYVESGTLCVANANERLPDSGHVEVESGATFMIDGVQETVGLLDGGGQVTLDNWAALRVGGGDETFAFNMPVSGDGAFGKDGSGTVTLSVANTHTGGTHFVNGVLTASADDQLGAAYGGLAFDGGTLQVTGTDFANTSRSLALYAGGGTIEVVEPAHALAISGDLNGEGDLTKTGAGTLALSVANGTGYTGDLDVQAGTMEFGGDAPGAPPDLAIASGAMFRVAVDYCFTIASLSGEGQLDLQDKEVRLLVDDQAEFAGLITGAGGVFRKAGEGMLTLGGNNTYDGGTHVDVGTLVADNDTACGTGPITLYGGYRVLAIPAGVTIPNTVLFSGGGTLTGTGTLASDLTVTTNGMVVPGNSAGVLTIDGDYTPQTESTLEIEIGGVTPGAEHDQLVVTGTANLSGTLDISLIDGYEWELGQSYVILTAGAVSGTFDTVTGPGQFDVTCNANSVIVTSVTLPGDLDGDGDVDIDDFSAFTGCMSGPDLAPPDGCDAAKLDADQDVDLADFASFQQAFTGSQP